MLRNNSNTGKIEARGSGREELPTHPRRRPGVVPGRTNPTVAARAQEGLEELSHVEGQEGRL